MIKSIIPRSPHDNATELGMGRKEVAVWPSHAAPEANTPLQGYASPGELG